MVYHRYHSETASVPDITPHPNRFRVRTKKPPIDARGFVAEGEGSLALAIVRLYENGFRRFLIAHAAGHRFNECLFGIPVSRLLHVDGRQLPPGRVYRKIRPRALRALQAEEAWVKKDHQGGRP